jgi:hypothetical protein
MTLLAAAARVNVPEIDPMGAKVGATPEQEILTPTRGSPGARMLTFALMFTHFVIFLAWFLIKLLGA